MSFAYLMNAYPMTSTTFIRREIEAHERAGFRVDRFAIRPWDVALVDPQDIAEAQRVNYLLGQGAVRLLKGFVTETLKNPFGMARALAATAHLIGRAKGERWKNLAYLLEATSLKRQAAVNGIDHIHTHFSSNSAAVAMLSHRLGGPGYSVTVHGPDELYMMDENSVALKLEHAAFFAVITEYCRGMVDDHTGGAFADKLHIVRCGLDLQEFDAASDLPEGQVIVCVGRLCAAKAQHLLVEALARVVDRHPGVKLVLIGDGETRPRIEQAIAAHGLQRNVELKGWRTSAEVRDALKGALALALPSLAEGLPIVIMESFALGRPVLSTVINGIPELVDGECGWLVAPGDVDALVPALEALLGADRDALSRMGRIGRARIEQLHDQDVNAARLRELIAQAVTGKVEPAPRPERDWRSTMTAQRACNRHTNSSEQSDETESGGFYQLQI